MNKQNILNKLKKGKVIRIILFSVAAIIVIVAAIIIISSIITRNKHNSFDLSKILTSAPISWGMTRQDFIDKNGNPDEINDSGWLVYSSDTLRSVYNGEYWFAFGSNDKLHVLRFLFDNPSDLISYRDSFIQTNGKPDRVYESGDSCWYGNVDGKESYFWYIKPSGGSDGYVSIEQK